MNKILTINRHKILNAAKKNGATSVKVFGSFAKESETENSDIDLLIEIEKGRDILDIIAFQQAVSNITNRKIDIVTEKGLHWYIREQILKEAVPI